MADGWHIVPGGVRKTTVLQQGGTGFSDVWEVPYVIDSGPAAGMSADVSIPAAMYNADNVRAAVQTAVDEHNKVAGL